VAIGRWGVVSINLALSCPLSMSLSMSAGPGSEMVLMPNPELSSEYDPRDTALAQVCILPPRRRELYRWSQFDSVITSRVSFTHEPRS
jgi:hypothetical protein